MSKLKHRIEQLEAKVGNGGEPDDLRDPVSWRPGRIS